MITLKKKEDNFHPFSIRMGRDKRLLGAYSIVKLESCCKLERRISLQEKKTTVVSNHLIKSLVVEFMLPRALNLYS